MKPLTQKKVIALQNKCNKFAEKTAEEIRAICETMDYKDSSTFSYNIDRLNLFINELNSFKK